MKKLIFILGLLIIQNVFALEIDNEKYFVYQPVQQYEMQTVYWIVSTTGYSMMITTDSTDPRIDLQEPKERFTGKLITTDKKTGLYVVIPKIRYDKEITDLQFLIKDLQKQIDFLKKQVALQIQVNQNQNELNKTFIIKHTVDMNPSINPDEVYIYEKKSK